MDSAVSRVKVAKAQALDETRGRETLQQVRENIFAARAGGTMEQFASLKRSKDGQPVRYLLVDDSVFARKNLARIVETFGGQVAGEAGDGMTAITEYERTNPDIVLMDITMPQMEGIEAAEKIVGQHPEARIVMVSSVGYQENIVAALQRGARHFVQKPVKPEVLYEVIKYVLGEDGAVANAARGGA
jgi:two-component system chemotaxis response regulator CheY